MTDTLFRHFFSSLLVATAACGAAHAQGDYPTRPIRFLVGVVPGGPADSLARMLGQRLSERFRQQVVVDNRPGANQTIAAEIAARSSPDGHTLLIVPAGHAINPSVYRLRYDTLRDFSPIAMVAAVPYALVIHPTVPGRTVQDFVAAARTSPGVLTCGSSGVGAASHLAAELFRMHTGVQFTHVPYNGMGPVVNDLLGGHLKMGFPSLPPALPHIKSGKLVALGVTPRQRSAALPALPTLDEAGVTGYEVSGWYGILGPAGMPKAVVARLNAEIQRILDDAAVREILSREGADPLPGTPDAFAKLISIDVAKWAKVVKAAGVKVE